MYKIIRFYYGNGYSSWSNSRIIKRGLTLEQAQTHCQDKETSSSTCTLYEGRKRTQTLGKWFDGYDRCRK